MFINNETARRAPCVPFNVIIDSDFRVLAFLEILEEDTSSDVRTCFVCRFVNLR